MNTYLITLTNPVAIRLDAIRETILSNVIEGSMPTSGSPDLQIVHVSRVYETNRRKWHSVEPLVSIEVRLSSFRSKQKIQLVKRVWASQRNNQNKIEKENRK